MKTLLAAMLVLMSCGSPPCAGLDCVRATSGCEIGQRMCDSKCIPADADCCWEGDNTFCPSQTYCSISSDWCIPVGHLDCHDNGANCPEGFPYYCPNAPDGRQCSNMPPTEVECGALTYKLCDTQ